MQIALFDRPTGLTSLQVGIMLFIGTHKAEVLEIDEEEMSMTVK
jgi:hypothetical protein